ncbi:hypothetical protein PsorP6_000737 [Peronosclerospora sorghi]|uniref:Uncharacterized protein n=1 Tax=Peronosclerospora sorghi TaxID=230839 RepID=A0ACC0WT14_9STRA|nr:hypothetical protein PsorP6_000737 [Peronosclerospora sorghi]
MIRVECVETFGGFSAYVDEMILRWWEPKYVNRLCTISTFEALNPEKKGPAHHVKDFTSKRRYASVILSFTPILAT